MTKKQQREAIEVHGIQPPPVPENSKTNKSFLDEYGRELVDSTPFEIPLEMQQEPGMQLLIQQYVRTEFSKLAGAAGHETFEEAEDFDVGDDYDPSSPYENEFDPVDLQAALDTLSGSGDVVPPSSPPRGGGEEGGEGGEGEGDTGAPSSRTERHDVHGVVPSLPDSTPGGAGGGGGGPRPTGPPASPGGHRAGRFRAR